MTRDPVVSAAVGVQGAISRWVAGLGPGVLLAVAVTVAVAGAVAVTTSVVRRTRAAP
ncbi:MAG: hypothetical protein LH603_09240 [Pseudonocardia sp.]|nr:hypothetical protein [Pseudonocardia sp.]